MRLKDRVTVITGGATGIGFAAARRFLAEGAKVVIAGRRQADLDRAVAELGGNVLAVKTDVTSLPDLKRLMTVVKERDGRIDVVVANAGVGRFGPLESVTPEVFDELTDVHFRGTFFTVQQAVPHMPRGGSLILVSSSGATRGFPMTSVYNAAKAAVRSLARTFATELAPRGIRVNVVSPGLTVTPMTQGDIGVPAEKRDEAARAQLSLIPMKRFLDAAEIANVMLFLASDESSPFTGAELAADGGIAQV
jgi:NAD(P)-dependent dehydrogenase (short-subunit alcohol dehydrogenase family)